MYEAILFLPFVRGRGKGAMHLYRYKCSVHCLRSVLYGLHYISYLQKDVVAESPEVLQLGLLFGEDINATTEDLPAVLSFQHKLLHEYLAAVYIAENAQLHNTSTFLAEAFPTWEKIQNHREVVQFACGILAENEASSITNHVAKVLGQFACKQLNAGMKPAILSYRDISLPLLESFEKEGNVSSTVNPYLCRYPACGHSLAQLLDSTEVIFIDGVDDNDKLQLKSGSGEIFLKIKLQEVDSERVNRLWQALHCIPTNVTALHHEVKNVNVTKLRHFSKLKYLCLRDCSCSETEMQDLAKSIMSWAPQPQLRYCKLWWVPIPRELMTALHTCPYLVYLDLSECHLTNNLSTLMATPPPALKDLRLELCSLNGTDVQHVTQAIRGNRLIYMQHLNINRNPIGEVAVGSLLEAIICTRPHTQLNIKLGTTGVYEDRKYLHSKLSKHFVAQWKTKISGTNINVKWR